MKNTHHGVQLRKTIPGTPVTRDGFVFHFHDLSGYAFVTGTRWGYIHLYKYFTTAINTAVVDSKTLLRCAKCTKYYGVIPRECL